MKIKALPVEIYKFPLGECTNHGVSSRNKDLLVACPDGHVEVDSENLPDNFCHVVPRRLFGNEIYYVIRPAEVSGGKIVDRGGHWYMMGGNLAYTSDARFHNLVGGMHYGIPIHDRVE